MRDSVERICSACKQSNNCLIGWVVSLSRWTCVFLRMGRTPCCSRHRHLTRKKHSQIHVHVCDLQLRTRTWTWGTRENMHLPKRLSWHGDRFWWSLTPNFAQQIDFRTNTRLNQGTLRINPSRTRRQRDLALVLRPNCRVAEVTQVMCFLLG